MHDDSTMRVTLMPAGHGDCILVQCGEFNVLVDSGPHDAAIHTRVRAALETALDGRAIHLAIITHHDSDHIGGLERMLEDPAAPKIEALLFNSEHLVREFVSTHSDEEMPASLRQARRVAGLRRPFNRAVILAGEEHPFDDSRVMLKMLAPARGDVLKFGSPMIRAMHGEESAGLRGRDTPICPPIADLLEIPDDGKAVDPSPTNAVSLAFILTFEARSVLFLGDSPADQVAVSLKKGLLAGQRMPFDMVVVSHHGSKNNTSEDMYRCLTASQFVVSTDGRQNPDLQTFARILRATPGATPTFHFSENSNELRTMFAQTDLITRMPTGKALSLDL